MERQISVQEGQEGLHRQLPASLSERQRVLLNRPIDCFAQGLFCLYRGYPRRIWAFWPGRHNRYYLLRFKEGTAPRDALTLAYGPRGQRRYIGVAVRADHAPLLALTAIKTAGRPRLVKREE